MSNNQLTIIACGVLTASAILYLLNSSESEAQRLPPTLSVNPAPARRISWSADAFGTIHTERDGVREVLTPAEYDADEAAVTQTKNGFIIYRYASSVSIIDQVANTVLARYVIRNVLGSTRHSDLTQEDQQALGFIEKSGDGYLTVRDVDGVETTIYSSDPPTEHIVRAKSGLTATVTADGTVIWIEATRFIEELPLRWRRLSPDDWFFSREDVKTTVSMLELLSKPDSLSVLAVGIHRDTAPSSITLADSDTGHPLARLDFKISDLLPGDRERHLESGVISYDGSNFTVGGRPSPARRDSVYIESRHAGYVVFIQAIADMNGDYSFVTYLITP